MIKLNAAGRSVALGETREQGQLKTVKLFVF